MNRRRFGSIITAVCLFLVGLPAMAWTPNEASQVDTVVTRALSEKQAPGAVVAIVEDGKVVYRKAFGLANVETKRAMSPDALFEIGSLTKQMTAAAVLQLASDGKLRLDDEVIKYTPQYPAAAGVTIRQLLQQVSGFPDFALTPEFAANGTKRPTDFAGILAAIQSQPREFPDGERWKYSNTNYVLLGQIIQRSSGMEFDEYLSRQIFKPAGMLHATNLSASPAEKATGYSKDGGHIVPAATFQNSWIGAAGNVVASVDDLIAWNRALSANPNLELMRTPATLNDGSLSGYGFGLYIDRQAGRARIWHGGGTLGFSSSLMSYPDEKLTIIALVNDGDVNASAMTAFIYDALHGIKHEPATGEQPEVTAKARTWLQRIKAAELPAGEVSENLMAALTKDSGRAYKKLQSQLDIFGRPEALVFGGRNGSQYIYSVRYGAQWLKFGIAMLPDGRVSALVLGPE